MRTLLTTLAALLVVVFLTAPLVKAQPEERIEKLRKDKKAVENLIAGINSENEGLRKSCIYFAGQYRIMESVESLVKALDKEENPQTRVLIALVLYKIGNPDGMAAVKELTYTDSNNYVRRMSNAILNAYIYDNVMTTASNY